MARIEIPIPDGFAHEARLTVRIADVNYGGHLGNDRLLSLLQEARLGLLAGWGFSERDAGGAGLIMTGAAVEYRAQAFYGDELRIRVAVGEIGRAAFDLLYLVTHVDTHREVARARTAMAFYDYAHNRVARMPAAFRARLGQGAGSE